MATLNTTHGELMVEGRIPRVVVIDTGASSIILGRAFGLHMERCQPRNLIYGDTFITAGGNSEKCLGKTKAYLSFTLAKGTQAETVITAPVIIADTDAYDVILGMGFLGACLGYVDPLAKEFIWRVDCHEIETMPVQMARLPATCRAKSYRERRHMYMLNLICSSEDLHDSILGDESKEESFSQVKILETDTVKTTVPIKLPRLSSFAIRFPSNKSNDC